MPIESGTEVGIINFLSNTLWDQVDILLNGLYERFGLVECGKDCHLRSPLLADTPGIRQMVAEWCTSAGETVTRRRTSSC